MNVIREVRASRCLSQRAFARKAAMSFRGYQLLEDPEHDSRLSSIRKVAAALNLPDEGIDIVLRRFLEQDRYSVVITSIRIQTDGFDSWPLHLFDFVDTFRSSPKGSLINTAPVDGIPANLRCLIASAVETLCAESGIMIPEWCYGVGGLKEPWFVSGVENLKAMALLESPVRFRKRNIFVLGNFMDRA